MHAGLLFFVIIACPFPKSLFLKELGHMEFTVKRNSLLDELNLVQGVIEKKSTIPILSNILLEATGERLNITATDLDVTICCGCAATVQEPGTMTVSARRLFEIARYLPDEAEIHSKLLENDWLEVSSGHSEYKVVGLPKENFPSVPEPAAGGVAIPGALLRAMIQRTIFAITQEESRYSLNGALLVIKAEEMRMIATDGHRLALVAAPMENSGVEGEMKALIPRKTLIEIQKLIGDKNVAVIFGKDDNHLFFSVEDKRLVSRVLAGQFPNYEMVVPRNNDKNVVGSTRALADGIRRTKVMSDERLRAVRFALSPGVLEITASSAEAGEAKDVVPVEYGGGPMEIGFNPDYLLDFLGVCGTELVNLSLRDSETQGMFHPAGAVEIDYKYIVMPMKF
jgi:DNA polymerase III subunit beta